MTEGQLRYQSLMEDQRHNMAIESYSKEQAAAATAQAEAATNRAEIEKVRALYDIFVEKPFRRRLDSRALTYNTKIGYMNAGSNMLRSFLGGAGSIGSLFA
jgi:hypothetical protein